MHHQQDWMETMNERISAIIKEKRNQGLSVRQLSDMCQLSVSTVSRTLSEKTEPTEFTVNAMEKALGITRETIEDPLPEPVTNDPAFRQYISTTENRINRMRAFYNMLLAEKDRSIAEKRKWIIFLVCVCLALIVFICAILIMDVSNLDTGWIRQRLQV